MILATLLLAFPIAGAVPGSHAPAALAALPTAQEPAPLPEAQVEAARALLARVAKTLEEVERIRAGYVQLQHSPLLAEPIERKGTLHLRVDPGVLLLELAAPRPAIVRSDARSHLVYHPEQKRAERWVFESNELARALLRLFSADVREVEEAFRIRAFRPGETAELELEPRGERLRRAIRSLTLRIDSDRALPVGVVHENPEGEQVAFELSDIELDPEIEEEMPIFDRPLPADVEVVSHYVKGEERRGGR